MSKLFDTLTNDTKYKAYCKKYGPYEVEGQISLMDFDWGNTNKDIPVKENLDDHEIDELSY